MSSQLPLQQTFARQLCRLPVAACLWACPSLANTHDWRFCVAIQSAQHVAYLTDVFESDATMPALQSTFQDLLEKRNLAVQVVQCPLPHDRREAEDAWNKARAFNTSLGYKLILVR